MKPPSRRSRRPARAPPHLRRARRARLPSDRRHLSRHRAADRQFPHRGRRRALSRRPARRLADRRVPEGIRHPHHHQSARRSQADWYKKEVAESQALGVHHVDFRLSASKQLTQQQVEQLITPDARRAEADPRPLPRRRRPFQALPPRSMSPPSRRAARKPQRRSSPRSMAISPSASRRPGRWTRPSSASSPGSVSAKP